MSPLTAALDRLRRRLRRVIVLRGVCRCAAAVLGLLGVLAAIDAVVHLDSAVLRGGLGLTVFAAGVVLAMRELVWPLSGRWDDVSLALLVEDTLPLARDRLASGAAFRQDVASGATVTAAAAEGAAPVERVRVRRAESDSPLAPALPPAGSSSLRSRSVVGERENAGGSALGAALRAEVIQEADLAALRLPWDSLVDLSSVWRGALALGVVLALLGGWWISAPQQALLAWERQFAPWSASDWPRTTVLAWLDENLAPLAGGRRCLAGEPCTLYVANREGDVPDDLVVWQSRDGQTVERVAATVTSLRDAGGRERRVGLVALTPESGVTRLRAEGGDDYGQGWMSLDATPAPQLERFWIRVTPPAYSGLPTTEDERRVGHVEGLIGSVAEVEAESNVPLRSIVLRRPDAHPEPVELDADHRRARFRLPIDQEGRTSYALELTDELGLASVRPQRYELRGRRDQPPTVDWKSPIGPLNVTPQARLPIEIEATDDLALASVELVYAAPARGLSGRQSWPGVVDLQAPPPQSKSARVSSTWDLSALMLEPGDVVDARIEARDRKSPEPQVGVSAGLTLHVVSVEDKLREIQGYQSGMSRLLARMEARQRKVTDEVLDLHTQWREAGTFRAFDRERLNDVDLERRRTLGDLTDIRVGLGAQIDRVLQELRWNRIDDPAVTRRMARLQTHLGLLVDDLLPRLGTQLAVLGNAIGASGASSGDANAPEVEPARAVDGPETERQLSLVEESQQQIAATFAAMQEELGEWRRQFDASEQFDELLAGQRRVHERTAELAPRLLSRSLEELQPQERADLAAAADGQQRLAAMLDRLTEQWRQSTETPQGAGAWSANSSSQAVLSSLTDGGLAALMHSASRKLAENRLGQALDDQRQVLQSLEQTLRKLADAGSTDADALLAWLADARQQVDELHRQQAELRQQLQQVRTLSADPAQQERLERLVQEHASLASQAEALASELRRRLLVLPAGTASRAAGRMNAAVRALEDQQPEAASAAQQDALDDLAQLDDELAAAERSAQQERLLARLADLPADLQKLIETQQTLIAQTREIEAERPADGRYGRSLLRRLSETAELQRDVERRTRDLAEGVLSVELVAHVLTQAAGEMATAAERLTGRQADAETLAAQQAAVDRLETLRSGVGAPPAAESGRAGPTGSAESSEAADQAARMLEIRLLRAMQADLLEQAEALKTEVGEADVTAEQSARLKKLGEEQLELGQRAAALLSGPSPAAESGTPGRAGPASRAPE